MALDKARVGPKKTRNKNDEIVVKRLGKIIEHILRDKAYDHKSWAETKRTERLN